MERLLLAVSRRYLDPILSPALLGWHLVYRVACFPSCWLPAHLAWAMDAQREGRGHRWSWCRQNLQNTGWRDVDFSLGGRGMP